MLQRNPLVREHCSSNVRKDLLWLAQILSLVVQELGLVDSLDQPQLHDSSVEWVQVVQDGVYLDFREVHALLLDDLLKVLEESLSGAEAGESLAGVSSSLEEHDVEAIVSQVISEPLHRLLRVSLDAFEVGSLVLVVELLYAPLELNLSCPEGVDLLELLEVEERLRNGELVVATRGGQEALELASIR